MSRSKNKPLTIAIIVVVVLYVITSAFNVVLPEGYTNLFSRTITESSIHINSAFFVTILIGAVQIVYLFFKKGELKVFSLLSSILSLFISLYSVPLYIVVMGIHYDVYYIQEGLSFGGDYVATPFGYAFIALGIVNVILQSIWCFVTRKRKTLKKANDNSQM